MAPTVAALARRQLAAFGVKPPAKLSSFRDAERFIARVGVALRYQATPGLPLASLRSAVGPTNSRAALETSIQLTNHLLEHAIAIEVTVVADRPTLVDRDLMPSLYGLVRRGRASDDYDGLTLDARRAAVLIRSEGAVTAGVVRRRLGLAANPRADPAYRALGELQRAMLVDRGPFVMPDTGIPYLSREGYPYRFLHVAHPEIVNAAARLGRRDATDRWVESYLAAAIFATPKKLMSLFRAFLTPPEIDGALERLLAATRLTRIGSGRSAVVVTTPNA